MSRHRGISTRHAQRPPESAASHGHLAALAMLLLIALATLVAYWPAMFGAKLWDDDVHITPPDLQSAEGLHRIWFELNGTRQYYPLLYTTFWLEHKLWGDAVVGYHLINIAWHLTAVGLLYLILQRLKVPGALLAAAIFALHPVMVESVAWMSEQKNTLSAVFYLSAMLAYLGFDESRRPSRYCLAFGLFALGLLTKTITASLPAALLVIFWWQRGTISWKRDVLPLMPLFALGAVAGVFTGWVERTLVGAEGADFEMTLVERFLLAGRVVWFYLGKLVWPTNLVFIYPRWKIDPSVWWQWLFPAAAIGMTVLLWSWRRSSRAPLAGWLFFVGTLFPALGFANVFPFVYSFVADHFQYLASLGIIVPVAAGIVHLLDRMPAFGRTAVVGFCLLTAGMLAALTWEQTRMYVDSETLFRTTLRRNPECWMAHNNLGAMSALAGRRDDAFEHYTAALRIKPDNPAAHNNLASILADRGQVNEGIEHYREAIRLLPDYFDARCNLANALYRHGQLPEARVEIQGALALKPNQPAALNTLGTILVGMQRYTEAKEAIERSLSVQPNYAEGHNNLANLLVTTGDVPGAIDEFRKSLAINSNLSTAHCNLGLVLVATGEYQESIAHLEKAIELGVDQPDLHNGLGVAYRRTNQPGRAIEHLQKAIQQNPDYVQAYSNLCQVLAAESRSDEAIAAAEKGIEAARSPDQRAIGEQLADWLRHYRTELQRSTTQP